MAAGPGLPSGQPLGELRFTNRREGAAAEALMRLKARKFEAVIKFIVIVNLCRGRVLVEPGIELIAM